jgi:hypothetical protein
MQLNSMNTYIEARLTWLTAVLTENGPFPFFSKHALLGVGWKVLLHHEGTLHDTLRSSMSAYNISNSTTRCDLSCPYLNSSVGDSLLNGIDLLSHCLNIFGLSLWGLLNIRVAPF